LITAALLAMLPATWIYRWWHNQAPFGPEALAATATLELADSPDGMDELSQLRVPNVPVVYANPGDQLVVGKVSWRRPPRSLAGGWFQILLIDKSSHLKPAMMSAGGPQPDRVTIGSDGVLNKVEHSYPWLRGAGWTWTDNQTFMSAGNSVSVFTEASPVGFVALFPAADKAPGQRPVYATAPVSRSDLLLALVYIGSDRQVYWAQRLLG
jgi:hypothetical protein